MKRQRIVVFIGFAGFLLLTMTGCVYVRLLKAKGQLRELDRYVQVEFQQGIQLTFLEPLLLPKDIVWLMKAEPTMKTNREQSVIWKYTFEKQHTKEVHQTCPESRLTLTMIFEQGKLHKFRFPPQISSELLPGVLRSVGTGSIDKKQRKVSANWHDEHTLQTAKIPNKQRIEEILGLPSTVTQSQSTMNLLYSYQLQSTHAEPQKTLPRVHVNFTFHEYGEVLVKAEVKFNDLSTSINFSKNL